MVNEVIFHIIDQFGNSVENAKIEVYDETKSEKILETVTNVQGKAKVFLNYDTYYLIVSAGSCIAFEDVYVVDSVNAEVTLECTRKEKHDVLFYIECNHTPVKGANIWLNNREYENEQKGTDLFGQSTLRIPYGKYDVKVFADGSLHEEQIFVDSGRVMIAMDCTMKTELHKVYFNVQDESGLPVLNARVVLNNGQYDVFTNENGRNYLLISYADYAIRVLKNHFDVYENVIRVETDNIDVILHQSEPLQHNVAFKVVDNRNNVLENAKIELYNNDDLSELLYEMRTDAEGKCNTLMCYGTYYMKVSANDCVAFENSYYVATDNITVKLDCNRRYKHNVSFYVFDKLNNPLEGAKIELYDDNFSVALYEVLTDEKGEANILLHYDTYYVKVSANDCITFENQYYVNTDIIKIKLDCSAKDEHNVAFHITNKAGDPVSDAKIELYTPKSEILLYETVTNEKGEANILLRYDQYYMKITAKDCITFENDYYIAANNINVKTACDHVEPVPESLIEEIGAYIGVPISPIAQTYIQKNFHSDVIQLSSFPCAELSKVLFDDEECSDFLEKDLEAGLIYLKTKRKARILHVEYKYGLTQDFIDRFIIQLAKELQALEKKGWSLYAGSFTRTEGNVSLTDSESVAGKNLIIKKLDALKNRFNVCCELL